MGLNNLIRAYNSFVLLVDSDPRIVPGVSAGVDSIATDSAGAIYKKTGKLDTDWELFYSPSPAPLGTYYGSFYDTTTQTNLASENMMQFNTTSLANGVSIVGGSQITLANAGIYNIQFSAQIQKVGGTPSNIEVWLKHGGSNVPWSNTDLYVQGNNQRIVAAWNFFESVAAGEYVEIAWSSPSANMTLAALSSSSTGPDIPSAILTVNQIG